MTARPRTTRDPLADVEERITRHPRDANLRKEWGELLAARGRWTDAAIAFAEAQSLDPQDQEARRRQLATAKRARATGDPRVPTRWAAFVRGYAAWTDVPRAPRGWIAAPGLAFIGHRMVRAVLRGATGEAAILFVLIVALGALVLVQHRADVRRIEAAERAGPGR